MHKIPDDHNDDSLNQCLNFSYTKFQTDQIHPSHSFNQNIPHLNNYIPTNPRVPYVVPQSIPIQYNHVNPIQQNFQMMNYMMQFQQMMSNPALMTSMMNQMNQMNQFQNLQEQKIINPNMSMMTGNENRMINGNISNQGMGNITNKFGDYLNENKSRNEFNVGQDYLHNQKQYKVSLRNPKINNDNLIPNLVRKNIERPLQNNEIKYNTSENRDLNKNRNEYEDKFSSLINNNKQHVQQILDQKFIDLETLNKKTRNYQIQKQEIQKTHKNNTQQIQYVNPASRKLSQKNIINEQFRYKPQTKNNNYDQPKSNPLINYDDIPIKSTQNQFLKQQSTKDQYVARKSTKHNTDDIMAKNNQKINHNHDQIAIKPMKSNLNQQLLKPSKNNNDFDQLPIKPMKNLNYDQIVINAQKNSSNFDDLQIKPTKKVNYDDIAINNKFNPKEKNQPEQIIKKKQSDRAKAGLSNQFDERPIKGMGKQFNQYIQNGEVNNNQKPPRDQGNFQKKPIVKNFLKKGTRQFLSSAKAKIKQDKQFVESPKQIKQIKKSFKVNKQEEYNKNSSIINQPIKSIKPKEKKIIDIQQKEDDQFKIEQNDRIRNKSPKTKKVSNPVNIRNQIKIQKKQVLNLFEDSDQDQYQKKEELFQFIPGLKLNQNQIRLIKQKCKSENEGIRMQNQKVQNLRDKYCEMISLLQSQKQKLKQNLQKEKQSFEEYKKQQLRKIKQQKRIAQRQKQAVFSNTTKKQKQELENLKKQWQKQKQEFRKRETSYKILGQKQRKQIQQLKRQLLLKQNKEEEHQFQTKKKNSTKHIQIIQKSLQKDIKKPKIKQQKIVQKQSNQFINKKKNNDPLQNLQNRAESLVQKTQKYNTLNTKNTLPDYQDIKSDRNKITLKNLSSKNETNLINNPKYNYQQEYKTKVKNQWGKNFQEQQFDQNFNEDQQNDIQNSFDSYHDDMTLSDLSKIKLSIKMVSDQMIQNLFHYNTNPDYLIYQQLKRKGRKKRSVETMHDKKVVTTYMDGSQQILYETGVKKQILSNGYMIVFFTNKDIKQKLPSGITLYYFGVKNVDQITLQNGINIFRFENNQVQFHFPNGTIQIRHPDGTVKIQQKN